MSDQQIFADALLAADPVCPPGLRTWNQSDPGRRFGVYRNNVIVSLIDALADTYPVTQALVGEEFFRAMALLFVRAHPPRSRLLAFYGDGLAGFIQAFPPVAGVPYLADVARLEMLRVLAYHAADAAPLQAGELSQLLAGETPLPTARFTLHPSVGILRSSYAVVSLWAVHQSTEASIPLEEIDTDSAEAALILRAGLDVEITRVPDSAAAFIMDLQRGIAFGLAAERTLAVDAAFDLVATLGLLIRGGAITNVTISRSVAS
ncbi:MAG: putative DNA-binding domain-containing protein [Betaproteobacteria bacterium]|nr:putative DNA-binding domain-containing protein [Betaproteobacteria bacterium]